MIYFGLKPIAKFLRSNNKRLGFAGGMGQIISQLFANQEQGFAFDFNDLSTMYQDSEGTIPVTGVGQPVGKVLDKSGRGNHATQSTSAKRPILQQNATTGAYYLAFDGVDDFLVTGSFPAMGVTPTIFLGSYSNTAAIFATVLSRGVASSAYIYYSNLSLMFHNLKLNGTTFSATARYISNGNAQLKSGNNIASGQVTNNGFNTTAPLYIGSFNGSQNMFQGNIYSLIGIARLATDAEITNTENAIAKNVGVTL